MLTKFKDIILFIDDDKAGRMSIDVFEEFYPDSYRVAVVKDKDPGACDINELKNAIEKAQPFNVFLIEDIGLFPKRQSISLSTEIK